MNYLHTHGALKEYQQIGVQGAISDANSHQLIQLLLQGALERIATAKGLMVHGDNEKGITISKAISILDGLRGCLNFQSGGEIAENLNQLYEYCQRRLLQANMDNNTSMLDEVQRLLVEVKMAWDSIPEKLTDDQATQAPVSG